jgi:hypothetical protein
MFIGEGSTQQPTDGLPVSILLMSSAYLTYVVAYCIHVWARFGRLPMHERLQHKERFKGKVFLHFPGLYLVIAAIGIAGLILSWWFGF